MRAETGQDELMAGATKESSEVGNQRPRPPSLGSASSPQGLGQVLGPLERNTPVKQARRCVGAFLNVMLRAHIGTCSCCDKEPSNQPLQRPFWELTDFGTHFASI